MRPSTWPSIGQVFGASDFSFDENGSPELRILGSFPSPRLGFACGISGLHWFDLSCRESSWFHMRKSPGTFSAREGRDVRGVR